MAPGPSRIRDLLERLRRSVLRAAGTGVRRACGPAAHEWAPLTADRRSELRRSGLESERGDPAACPLSEARAPRAARARGPRGLPGSLPGLRRGRDVARAVGAEERSSPALAHQRGDPLSG